MTSDLRLFVTACVPCLYKPVFGTALGKSSSAAFNSQTTLPKLVFKDCWDLANPNNHLNGISQGELMRKTADSDEFGIRLLVISSEVPRHYFLAFISVSLRTDLLMYRVRFDDRGRFPFLFLGCRAGKQLSRLGICCTKAILATCKTFCALLF
jgi:hypothetical protein